MKEFMRRHGLTGPWGFLAALGAVVLIAFSAACGMSSPAVEETTTTPALNADPREGRVYYGDTAEGEMVVVDGSDAYLYYDMCNKDGDLVRFYYLSAAETLVNHTDCQSDRSTPEPTPSPTR